MSGGTCRISRTPCPNSQNKPLGADDIPSFSFWLGTESIKHQPSREKEGKLPAWSSQAWSPWLWWLMTTKEHGHQHQLCSVSSTALCAHSSSGMELLRNNCFVYVAIMNDNNQELTVSNMNCLWTSAPLLKLKAGLICPFPEHQERHLY